MLLYTDSSRLKGFISDAQLVELTDDLRLGVADEQVIEKANRSAVNYIHPYLRKIYALPFAADAVPDEIADLTSQLLVVMLYERRDAANIPEEVRLMKGNITKRLEGYQRGDLVLDAPVIGGEPRLSKVNKTKDDRLFGKNFLSDFGKLDYLDTNQCP